MSETKDFEKEKQRLECLKLAEELHQLKKPLHKKPVFYGAIAPVILGVTAFLTTWLGGWFDTQNEHLENKRTLLQIETAGLEAGTKKLEQEKQTLVVKYATLDKKYSEKSQKLEEVYKTEIIALKEKLANYNKVLMEYWVLRNKLESKATDTSKPLPEETTQELEVYQEKLAQIKTEEEYSSADWFYKGRAEYEKKKYVNAIAFFTKALDKDPAFSDVYSWRAFVYSLLRKYEKAIEDYNKAIELNPKASDYYEGLALMYIMLNQFEKAIESVNKAIKLSPKHGRSYYNRGFSYAGLKKYEKAIKDYNKAIKLFPEYTRPYVKLSEVKIITGDYEDTLKIIETTRSSVMLGIEYKALLMYYECIAKKLLGMDTLEVETAFNQILKNNFSITWNFYFFESWLEDANFNDNTKAFIKDKTELLKKIKSDNPYAIGNS
jgi:tetratricopeptide (TPR) repeat protein